VILVDTRGLLANYDRSDEHHRAVVRILRLPQRRILSPFVLAELDYLVEQVAGQYIELAVLEDVVRGVYELAPFDSNDVAAAVAAIKHFADLRLGLADASIVVLAKRYACYDVLTLDQRHFRAVTGSGDTPFRLLPFDA
jgi:predicted nucleic acid-binding protein